MPAPGLLHWSRLPMPILAALVVLLLFWLLRRAAGRAPALIFVFLFLLSPYLRQTLSRAMAEAPLLAFTTLAILAGERVAHHGRRARTGDRIARRHYLVWTGAMGVCSGLAGASKLNGLAVAMAAAAIAIVAVWRPSHGGASRPNWRLAMAGAGIATALTAAAFILINPFLYPSPIQHTRSMFDQRRWEMARQVERWPESRLPGGRARLPAMVERSLRLAVTQPTGRLWWLVGLLALAGGVAAGGILRQRWRENEAGDAVLVLALAGACMVIPVLFSPLAWHRYFLLPVVFTLALVAVGIDYLWRLGWRWSGRSPA